MPKRRSGRSSRSKNFAVLPFDGDLALGALADEGVVLSDIMGGALTHDFYAISADLNAVVTGLTAGEGDPSRVGFAHGDYTTTEIAEKLGLTFLGPGDKIAQERSRRLVRTIGAVQGDDLNTQTTMRLKNHSGGNMTRTKLKFMIQKDRSINIWFQNQHGGTLTTGASLRFSGMMYGRWVY